MKYQVVIARIAPAKGLGFSLVSGDFICSKDALGLRIKHRSKKLHVASVDFMLIIQYVRFVMGMNLDGTLEHDRLSRRELLAVQGILDGKTKTAALLDAGYTLSVARTRQKDVFGRTRVRRALAHALEEAGVTDDLKARVLVEGLKTRREYQTREGVATDGGPDHGTRLKYLKLALELSGDLNRAEDSETPTFEAMVASLPALYQGGE